VDCDYATTFLVNNTPNVIVKKAIRIINQVLGKDNIFAFSLNFLFPKIPFPSLIDIPGK